MRKASMARGERSRHDIVLTALAAGISAAMLLFGCDGSATQTTTGLDASGLSGILVDAQGRPAAGARVSAWPANSPSPIGHGNTPLAVSRTDAQGRYALDLESGTYNVFAQAGQGALAAGITGVSLSDSGLDLGRSTLLPPGSVSGRVLAGGAPAAEVFCFIPGSAFVTMTDSGGRFSLAQVPAGRYPLRYVGAGLAAALDSITVLADSALVLPDRVMVPDVALQPPVPAGVRALADTATGFVTLTWSPVKVADLAEYVVESRVAGEAGAWERVEPPYAAGREDTAAVPDTVRLDSAASWPFSQAAEIQRGTGTLDSCRREYRIRAVDKDGNRSPAYSETVTVLLRRPPILRAEVRLARLGGSGDSAVCRDTLDFAASFTNPVVESAVFDWSVKHYVPLGSTFHTLYKPYFQGGQPRTAAADTLQWWWGKGFDSSSIAKLGPDAWETPDSLYIDLRIWIDGKYGVRRKIIDVLRPSPGCYLARPARDPRLGE